MRTSNGNGQFYVEHETKKNDRDDRRADSGVCVPEYSMVAHALEHKSWPLRQFLLGAGVELAAPCLALDTGGSCANQEELKRRIEDSFRKAPILATSQAIFQNPARSWMPVLSMIVRHITSFLITSWSG